MVGKSYNWWGIARVLTRESARYRRMVGRSVMKNRAGHIRWKLGPLNCQGALKDDIRGLRVRNIRIVNPAGVGADSRANSRGRVGTTDARGRITARSSGARAGGPHPGGRRSSHGTRATCGTCAGTASCHTRPASAYGTSSGAAGRASPPPAAPPPPPPPAP